MTIRPLKEYASLVFDCDGVVLDSNRVKTEAFYKTAAIYGENAARLLVNYHVANGGVSRYRKFELFMKDMIPVGVEGPDLDELLANFAIEVRRGLTCCNIAQGLDALRDETRTARWFIVSGGDQRELRQLFEERGLEKLFDGGIFGSPDTKDEILAREISLGNIRKPAIFLGDSQYDYEAAQRAGIDFLFMHLWSEFRDWEDYCRQNGIVSTERLLDLLNLA